MGATKVTSPIEMLRLAHPYQLPRLAAICASTAMEQVSVQNVAEIVVAMKEFDGDEAIAQLWPRLLHKVEANDQLSRASRGRHIPEVRWSGTRTWSLQRSSFQRLLKVWSYTVSTLAVGMVMCGTNH